MENNFEIIQVTKQLICCKESFYFGQKTFPIVVEISKRAKPFKVDLNDPNFFKPYSELEKNYQQLNFMKGIKHVGYISERQIKEYEIEGYFLKKGQKINQGIGAWDFIKTK